ncbi:MAG TPA: transposase [Luteimonas sp.]|nr:transposase [Luteimonas sp.]
MPGDWPDTGQHETRHDSGMASPKLSQHRQSKTGCLYAVTTATYRRLPLLTSKTAANVVSDEINTCAIAGLVENFAWVVMPDHIHWLLQLRSDHLKICLQRFKSRSARAINIALGRDGTVWQPGFYDHYLRSDEDLRKQAQYIVQNPVRAGIAARIEDYPHWWCEWIRDSSDLQMDI